MRYYISIEKNIEVFEQYKTLWKKLDVIGIRADTMSGGLEKAIEIEKSLTDELYFIDIVADDIDYMAQLRILDERTKAPILIATSTPNNEEHHESLNNGADFYGAYCEATEQNINAVISVIYRINQRAKKQIKSSTTITYGGIIIAPSWRNTILVN
jgi:DNA-binding response OmpR family regulator